MKKPWWATAEVYVSDRELHRAPTGGGTARNIRIDDLRMQVRRAQDFYCRPVENTQYTSKIRHFAWADSSCHASLEVVSAGRDGVVHHSLR
jgi:hypothetical protein